MTKPKGEIGDIVSYKCPFWHFEGEIIELTGHSSFNVKITKVHYAKSKNCPYFVDKVILMNRDEIDKVIE